MSVVMKQKSTGKLPVFSQELYQEQLLCAFKTISSMSEIDRKMTTLVSGSILGKKQRSLYHGHRPQRHDPVLHRSFHGLGRELSDDLNTQPFFSAVCIDLTRVDSKAFDSIFSSTPMECAAHLQHHRKHKFERRLPLMSSAAFLNNEVAILAL
ncbi:hypothetical protein PsorP6_009933 [Peronosclerospora sorghi]|uniref:Uncharacterized protein n=1 Tax=Peronosclerospora sorghi TaxID=230839 RepID=A0ACC0VU18_9STRA|nr:hypothetical protein PsorP6_009933 [Peronosclerospora sorghi]